MAAYSGFRTKGQNSFAICLAPPDPYNLCNHHNAKFCQEGRERRDMQSAPILWETNVLHVVTLITIYSVHTFRCLTAPMLYAVSRFLIANVVTQPRARLRDRKVTCPCPTPRFAAPHSEDELLVVVMPAANAAHFVLNVVTADEDSRLEDQDGPQREGEKPESRPGSGPLSVRTQEM
jgi:hypothetical protein